jgi:alpha-N-arabinofuranosidase
VHVSIVNIDPHHAAHLSCHLDGFAAQSVSGRILTAPAIDSVNTFASPNAVTPAAFTAVQMASGMLTVDLPAKSVVVLELK